MNKPAAFRGSLEVGTSGGVSVPDIYSPAR